MFHDSRWDIFRQFVSEDVTELIEEGLQVRIVDLFTCLIVVVLILLLVIVFET